jgi:hypothetical protein
MNDAGVKLLAAVIGFWVIMRAVNRDASGRTLVDHILGQSGGANQLLPTDSYTNAAAAAPSGAGVQALLPTMNQIGARMGWNASQVAAWAGVENREDASGSLTAKNPTSNAYGLAQFINGPGEYAQYGGNATTAAGQLTAMANYIKQRYVTPQAALAHEQQYGWY